MSAATQLAVADGGSVASYRHAIAYLQHQKEILFGQRVRRATAFFALADGAARLARIASPSERGVIQSVYELLAQAPASARTPLVAWLLLHGVWTRGTWLALLAGKTTRTALMTTLTEAVLASTNAQFEARVQAIADAATPLDACVALTCVSHAHARE